MRITDVRLVDVTRSRVIDEASRRHESRSRTSAKAFPINKYPEFPRQVAKIPGRSQGRAWVQVTAEDGTWGLGRCDWPHLVAPLIEQVYHPLLLNRDCLAIELLNDLLWRAAQPFGATGLAAVGRSAIDLALWDLKGKLLDVPVYSLLGGPVRPDIALYATTDDLRWAKELGFTAFKVTNPVHYDEGSRGLDTIEALIADARDTVGHDAELMFNPVMSFNVEFAARLAERLRPYKLRWLEEPILPYDVRGHQRLRWAFSPIPLATGEHLHGRHAFRELIDHGGVDIVQPDILWCGGLTETLKVYTLAEAAGLTTIPHFSGSTAFGVHFSVSAPECPMAEYWLTTDPGIPLDRAGGVPGTPVPENGRIRPSDAPGFGYDLEERDIQSWSA